MSYDMSLGAAEGFQRPVTDVTWPSVRQLPGHGLPRSLASPGHQYVSCPDC